MIEGKKMCTLHKPTRTKFRRRKINVARPNKQLQADLVDVRSHTDANDGYNFILTDVDCFARKVWTVHVKSKIGVVRAEALDKFFRETHFTRHQTDKGKEFYSAPIADTLTRYGTHYFNTENKTMKASLIELSIRMLRGRIHRYLPLKSTERFIDVLPRLVKT